MHVLEKVGVDRGQVRRRLVCVFTQVRAADRFEQREEQRRRDAVSRHVAQKNGEAPVRQGQNIEEVAPDGLQGTIPEINGEAFAARRFGGEEGTLDYLRGFEIVFYRLIPFLQLLQACPEFPLEAFVLCYIPGYSQNCRRLSGAVPYKGRLYLDIDLAAAFCPLLQGEGP